MTIEERKMYQIYGYRMLPRRIEEAKTRILAGLKAMKNPTISMSFGKDSTVLSHLLRQTRTLPLIYVDCGEGDEWPDTARVKTEFLQRCPAPLIVLQGPSILQAFEEGGYFLEESPNTTKKQNAEKRYNQSLGKIIDNYLHQNGYDGSFMGLRREESHNRNRLFAMRSSLYFAKTRGLWACCPLETWTGKDVWAYIVKYELPYNELYDKAVRGGRERARNGAMSGNVGYRYGRLAELKLTNPRWFNQLCKKYPEIRQFV